MPRIVGEKKVSDDSHPKPENQGRPNPEESIQKDHFFLDCCLGFPTLSLPSFLAVFLASSRALVLAFARSSACFAQLLQVCDSITYGYSEVQFLQ
jgi:hypothetical protein